MWSPLKYQNPAYTNIAPGKSNGNISEIDWKSASDGVLKRYSYTYDALNRLKDAVYTEPNTTNPYNNYYNEYATYDLNGNIKTLKRNAFPVTGTTATQVDDLIYQYTGNRLDKVIENALNDTGYEGGNNTIDYDLNGNMINMKDKGIQTIGYNVLDLQNQLSISVTNAAGKVSTTNINHIYGAGGIKLRKTSVQQAYMGLPRIQTTDYLDGFQYTNIDDGQGCLTCKTESAYEEQAYRKVIGPVIPGGPKWTLDFVPTAEGFYSFTENRYIYQYKDHLGNVRVSFARNSAGAPEITGTNNYYPFGLNHIGGGKSPFSNYHSYKFGGKELQETGMYDFGARMYMPDLGRWGVIDPMAEAMRRYSPYNYAFNNPISFIDPDGMAPMHQFAMISDARPDTTSGWTNPGWLGRGAEINYGAVLESYGGGGVYETEGTEYTGEEIAKVLKNLQALTTSYDFSKFDFTQYGDDPGKPVSLSVHKSGKKVLDEKKTFLGKLWNYLEPRQWSNEGVTYNVDGDGKIIGVAPITGDVPLGPGGVFKGPGLLKKIPSIDATRKVHGALPRVIDLVSFSRDELKILVQELKISVKQRIKMNTKLGSDLTHAERQGAEQNLIKYIEKYLDR